MRKIVFGVILTLLVVFTLRYCDNKRDDGLEEASALIEQQVKNVGKLVVTEGNFSQVFTYEDSKKFYLDIFSARKKALIVVNAKVSIAYDLRQLQTKVDTENKVITIKNIPKEEISINPDIEYYDVSQDYLNQFEAKDYNKIKKRIDQLIEKKIEASDIKQNAKNRLISELSNIYILTRSLGWTLKYEDRIIEKEGELNQFLP
ncbi:DUF4230 domain-containing protein [Leeuwenhoekiella sp. A16]|uniref:DUF4230 domain-containing protein n=1 Tax=unclassified Leeuwenhoekiella TaxID=2615029 RepID=UPI003A7FEB6F